MSTKDLSSREATRIELTIYFPNGGRLSPEDIALIDSIRKQRSILGASRATGVSYRKCWLMVDALNRTFETPVIATYPGRRGGGAEMTPFGDRLVALYHSMNRRSRTTASAALEELSNALNSRFQPRASCGDTEYPSPVSRRRQSRQS
jgi:molybdate transport system regulatory protein